MAPKGWTIMASFIPFLQDHHHVKTLAYLLKIHYSPHLQLGTISCMSVHGSQMMYVNELSSSTNMRWTFVVLSKIIYRKECCEIWYTKLSLPQGKLQQLW